MIDCPALYERHHEQGYPYGERVPATVRPTRAVHSDLAWLSREGGLSVFPDRTHDAWTNSYGAVSAVLPGGQMLALRPGEFEILSWHEPGQGAS